MNMQRKVESPKRRRSTQVFVGSHYSSSFIPAHDMAPTTPQKPTATMSTWAPFKGNTTRGVLGNAKEIQCKLPFTDTPPSTPTKRPTLVSTNAPARPMHEKSRDGHQTRGEAQRKLAGELKGADDEENAERFAALLGAFAVCVLVGLIVSHMRESCVVGPLQTLMGAGILSLTIVPVFVRVNPLTTSFVCALLLTAFAYTVDYWASLNNHIIQH